MVTELNFTGQGIVRYFTRVHHSHQDQARNIGRGEWSSSVYRAVCILYSLQSSTRPLVSCVAASDGICIQNKKLHHCSKLRASFARASRSLIGKERRNEIQGTEGYNEKREGGTERALSSIQRAKSIRHWLLGISPHLSWLASLEMRLLQFSFLTRNEKQAMRNVWVVTCGGRDNWIGIQQSEITFSVVCMTSMPENNFRSLLQMRMASTYK